MSSGGGEFSIGRMGNFQPVLTQARSLDEVTDRMREAIALCLEVQGAPEQELEFIGIQRVTIAA
ncbi:MAG TPA: hypothetical protein VFA04_25020 [Bryobacteraceae bacterium]|nr:hypothetical protein [Bryobacteraceae bacterium]